MIRGFERLDGETRMSQILWQEIRWTYRWLRTYIPWRLTRHNPVIAGIVRRAWRQKMRENRVFAFLWTWLRGR